MKALPKTQNRANLSSDKKDGKTGGLMKKLFNSSPKTDEDQEGIKITIPFTVEIRMKGQGSITLGRAVTHRTI